MLLNHYHNIILILCPLKKSYCLDLLQGYLPFSLLVFPFIFLLYKVLHTKTLLIITINMSSLKYEDARKPPQCRATMKTIACKWVFRFNDRSSFHLENDFWDNVYTWNIFLMIDCNLDCSWLLAATRSLFIPFHLRLMSWHHNCVTLLIILLVLIKYSTLSAYLTVMMLWRMLHRGA